MTKKSLIRVMALCGIAVLGLCAPKTVKADALPCTVNYLNQANAMKASAEAEVATAKADLAAKQAVVNSLRAAGNTSGMDYILAVSDMEAAQRMVDMKISAVSNANNYVKDCTEKYAVEDNASKAYAALQDLNVVQSSKLAYDNAQDVANTAAAQVNATKSAIAGYQAQLATCPSVQAQIDALNSQLVSLQADYESKQAIANQKKAAYESSLNSNYAAYDKTAIEYIYNRDDMRAYTVTDLNMDNVVNGVDYFLGVAYMQGHGGDHVFYNINYGGAR